MAIAISVFTYLILFIIAISLINKATQRKYIGKKYWHYMICSAVIVCIFAATRNVSVGTDTTHYYSIFQHIGTTINFTYALRYSAETGLEPFFCLFTTLVGGIFNNFVVYLFILNMMILLPIYIVADELSDQISPVAVLTVYFFCFFNMTLNISRQTLAASLVMLAFVYLFKGNKIKFVIFSIIAVLFHTSAIVGVLGCILGFMYLKKNSLKNFFITIAGVSTIVIVLSLNFLPFFANVLAKYGFGNITRISVFSDLFGGSTSSSNALLSDKGLSFYILLLVKLLFLIPWVYAKKRQLKGIQNIASVISFYGIFSFVFGSIVFGSIYIYRLTIYLEYFSMIFFPVMWNDPYEKKCERKLMVSRNTLLFVICIFIYWFIIYILMNLHETNCLFV